ncbi:hypothetical protein COP2_024595 [Malus domestica]
MVRGPVGDMKDGRHMLSGEEGIASSPRFKSKRRSEGPDIFKVLKEEENGQIKILEVQEGSFHKRKFKCALKRTACLYKKNQHSTGFQRSKRRAQNLKRPFKNRRGKLGNRRSILLFQTRRHPSHANSTLRKSRVICRSADPRYRKGASLFSRVNTCHIHTQLCANHGQFVEDFWVKEKAREVYCSIIQRLPTRMKE